MKKGILANPLFLIVGVPLLFLLVVGVVGLTPKLLVDPQHDFLYVTMENYYYGDENPNYYIEDGKLKALQDIDMLPPLSGADPETVADRRIRALRSMQLYLFDVSDWKSRPISFEDAAKYSYDSASVSPDGYSIERGTRTEGFFPFFFMEGSSGEFVLKKGLGSRPLPIGYNYSYRGSGLIGWVIQ